MLKMKILTTTTILGTTASCLAPLSCLFVTSCSKDVKSIDASDWQGIINGKFYPDSYIIDQRNETVTYISSVGVRFLDLVIPNYVRYNKKKFKVLLGPKCFENNLWLAGKIELNDFIDSIPDKCFAGCHNLETVIFHKQPQNIGDLAFASTPVEKLYIKINGQLSDTWGMRVKYIGDMAFYGSWISGDLTFGHELYYIGEYAFGDCFNVDNIDISSAINMYQLSKGCFEGCTSLRYVYLPPQMKTIGELAFQSCSSLYQVVLPRDGMEMTLGDDAFYNCSALTTFSREMKINSIGDRCFFGDKKLEFQPWATEYGVRTIGISAFESTDIGAVSFNPEHLDDVLDTAFAYCPKLAYIDFTKYGPLAEAPKWTGRGIFNYVAERGTILVADPFSAGADWEAFFKQAGINIDAQTGWTIKTVKVS